MYEDGLDATPSRYLRDDVRKSIKYACDLRQMVSTQGSVQWKQKKCVAHNKVIAWLRGHGYPHLQTLCRHTLRLLPLPESKSTSNPPVEMNNTVEGKTVVSNITQRSVDDEDIHRVRITRRTSVVDFSFAMLKWALGERNIKLDFYDESKKQNSVNEKFIIIPSSRPIIMSVGIPIFRKDGRKDIMYVKVSKPSLLQHLSQQEKNEWKQLCMDMFFQEINLPKHAHLNLRSYFCCNKTCRISEHGSIIRTTDIPINKQIKCHECNIRTCLECNQEAHAGLCSMTGDEQSDILIGETTKACPICETNTEKNDGCDHMRCIRCKSNWCWRCAGPLDRNFVHIIDSPCARPDVRMNMI